MTDNKRVTWLVMPYALSCGVAFKKNLTALFMCGFYWSKYGKRIF